MEHTPTPWKLGIWRKDPSRPPTIEEIKEMLCESVDRTVAKGGHIPDFWIVLTSDDPDDPVHACIVGNGPTSEQNCRFIVEACNTHDALRDEIERLRAMVCPCGRPMEVDRS